MPVQGGGIDNDATGCEDDATFAAKFAKLPGPRRASAGWRRPMENLESLLYRSVYGPVTVLHIVGGLVVFVVLGTLMNMFTRARATKHAEAQSVRKSCPSCGWTGKMSRHAKRCPSCNQMLA
jgi:hypothetical protein